MCPCSVSSCSTAYSSFIDAHTDSGTGVLQTYSHSSLLVQGEDGEWFVWKVFKRDTFGSNTAYQEILKEGRKKGLSVTGNRIARLELEFEHLQKEVV